MQKQEIENLFTYHPPRLPDLARYDAIREAGKYFATVVFQNTPSGPDQLAAIRKIREAVMTANAAIACQGFPEIGMTQAMEPDAGKGPAAEAYVERLRSNSSLRR